MKCFSHFDEPFTVRAFEGVFDNYDELLETFPECPKPLKEVGHKYHLNEKHPEFATFLKSCPAWKRAHQYLTKEFHELIGVEGKPKFEFSALPADGGYVLPHPDTKKKKFTAVFYFPQKEWREEYGGGFQMYRHKTEPDRDFTNWRGGWDEVDIVKTFEFIPNVMILMKRTNQSLHGVSPIQGPKGMFRQTLTINWI